MLFDHFPATIAPWPDGVPQVRVRAVGFPEGLAVLWDPGGTEGVQRRDFTDRPYEVVRAAGCACGSRRLRSAKVTWNKPPEPEPEPKKRRSKKQDEEPVEEAVA